MEYDITTRLGTYEADLAVPAEPAKGTTGAVLATEVHDAAAALCSLVGRAADLMEVRIAVADDRRWAVVRVASIEKDGK